MNPYGRKFLLLVLVIGVWYALYVLFQTGIVQTVGNCPTPSGSAPTGVIPAPFICNGINAFGFIFTPPNWLFLSIMLLKQLMPLAVALFTGVIFLKKTKQ